MIIFQKQKNLKEYLSTLNISTTGFVPTMGALHLGHISLIQESNNKCDITICSIYINPTQFNNIDDFLNYPKKIENDIKLLNNNNCDILYCPESSDLYKKNEKPMRYCFNGIEKTLEMDIAGQIISFCEKKLGILQN